MRLLVSGKGDFSRFLKSLARRGESGFERVEGSVRKILRDLRKDGDSALFRLTQKYDGWPPSSRSIRVTSVEIQKALKALSRKEWETLEFAARRIEGFHSLQLQRSWSFAEEDGTILGQIVRPMERVGIYVPGGKAAYPSTVLMNAIPARVAGVREIIMACPAPKGYLNPAVLAA